MTYLKIDWAFLIGGFIGLSLMVAFGPFITMIIGIVMFLVGTHMKATDQ